MKEHVITRRRPSARRLGVQQRGAAGLIAQYIQELSGGTNGAKRRPAEHRPLAVAQPCEGV